MAGFFHTYNRGVEKRKIFLEDKDYFRAIHDLYEFNDANKVFNLKQKLKQINCTPTAINGAINVNFRKSREKLVNLIVWCLMPNHYHLFLNEKAENGVSKFHQKFGGGFTSFFNLKYKRNGVLFQGKYKKIEVGNDTQVLQLICYIHANPLDIWKPDWKEKGLTNSEIPKALKFLKEEYRWSSHLDYLGGKNFPSLISGNNFSFFENSQEYEEFFINWLKYYEKNRQFIRKEILE